MTKIDGGATLWARQTTDSDIFYKKPHVWFKIWFYLINQAQHKDNKRFKRGSCFMKYEWIMEKTKAKKNEVDHCIRWLKSATMIATTKATRGFIVKVNKYDPFQSLENYKSDTKSDSKSDLKAKQKRFKSETKATLLNKNGNNGKYDKNEKKEYMDAVFLTQIEYDKLIEELGGPLTKEYIKDLSLYIQSQGKEKQYKSHYATILAWHRKDTKEGKNRLGKPKMTQEEALERMEIKENE